jgi:hypothetical protein
MKPKFKMSKQEMLDFNDACDNAACQCPQYRSGYWGYSDRDILQGEVKPKTLVKHWLMCDTLWRSSYNECLDSDAIQTIIEYKQYKLLRRQSNNS